MHEAHAQALDIETDGLGPDCRVTCVCVWDGTRGQSWVGDVTRHREEIEATLGAASQIWAFNGAHFDLPVLARCLHSEHEGAWQRKLVDPLLSARALFGTGACVKLATLLELNNLESKSASGAEAVAMAREGRWSELEAYCMQDTRLTYELMALPSVRWPNRSWRGGWWRPQT